MMRKTRRIGWVAAVVLLLGQGTVAHADIFVLSTADGAFDPGVRNQGWYATGQPNFDANDNYFIGESATPALRNFFTFDLSSVTIPVGEQVISAELQLIRGGSIGEEFEIIGFFHVSTDAETLNNNVGINVPVWEDLGSGVSYGEFEVLSRSTGFESEVLAFDLNDAAISDIAGSLGGYFSLGGALLSDDSEPSVGHVDFFFSGTPWRGLDNHLVIETAVIPAPGAALLAMLALPMVGWVKRRCG